MKTKQNVPVDTERIKEAMRSKKYTTSKLAWCMDVHVRTIQRIFKTGEASLKTIEKIEKVLETDVSHPFLEVTAINIAISEAEKHLESLKEIKRKIYQDAKNRNRADLGKRDQSLRKRG